MYGKPGKKLCIFYILEIMKERTDENHTLKQSEIVNILRDEYDLKVDRRTVKTNLKDLEALGYDVRWKETGRETKNYKTGKLEDTSIHSQFYIVRDISDSELRLLIDSLLFSNHIPYRQCKKLIEKIERRSNKYFKSHMTHIHAMPKDNTDNKQIFYIIDMLDEAIRNKKKVAFKYLDYGTDKKMHKKCIADGTEKTYIINPYQMAAKEGRYYLICNYDKYDDISNFRIDRITDIEILDDKVKPYEKLEVSNGKRFSLSDYMKQHIYMFSSENVRVNFRINKSLISDVIDMFGTDINFYNETENTVCVKANVNEQAMVQYAKNYVPDIVILEPENVRQKVIQELKNGLNAYK